MKVYYDIITIAGHMPRLRISRPDEKVEDHELTYYDALILASKLMDAVPFHKAKFNDKI